jgi:hypothetical protein
MPDFTIHLLVTAATLAPFILLYWIGRFISRRRLATVFRQPRSWQLPTLQAWVRSGWLDAERVEALPQELPAAVVFYEWSRADPEIARHWRFRQSPNAQAGLETLVRDAWNHLPPGPREKTSGRLAEAVKGADAWWGGAERGWNGRPLAVPAAAVSRKQGGLPLLPVDDLTGAPLAAPILAEKAAQEAEGPELVLLLAALRRSSPRFRHPLAPRAGSTNSMIEGLSTRVVSDVGRRLGGGLGAVLGPIGSMVGQYVGEMAGRMGGKALAQGALPAAVSQALKETEEALAQLGRLAEGDAFVAALREPSEAVLEWGRGAEKIREARSRGVRERVWPSAGLGAVEEALRVALGEVQGYRSAARFFLETARGSGEAVAGGMLLQNPWLVRRLPDGVERLNKARAALNRAAAVARSESGSG